MVVNGVFCYFNIIGSIMKKICVRELRNTYNFVENALQNLQNYNICDQKRIQTTNVGQWGVGDFRGAHGTRNRLLVVTFVSA